MPAFPIENLSMLGFSERLLARWRATGVGALLPLQVKAIQDYGFLQGVERSSNLLVLAPTSSGKTFVGELAALRHLEAGRRVVYLVPTKALAEEKGRLFRERYGPLGYGVAVATRERPETDRLVAEGRFDLLVAVYEKLKAYLVSRPQLLGQLGLVVVDEIQTLGERGRGEGLDLLLGKILASPWKPQMIGISAVLAEGGRLAGWLGCDLLLFRQRPVELREGVLDISSGRFRYRCMNSGEEGEEALIEPHEAPALDEADPDSPLLALAHWLAEAMAEQVILFVPTRHQSRLLARKIAAQSPLASAAEAVEELGQYEETASRNLLMQCLQSGVAFHNSDLSADLRALVESHYGAGAIRVLVSTSTLSQGVNLTGRNVIQVPRMAAMDPWTGETTFVPLSVSRFRNQGGRAGRYQLAQDDGRSILLASGPDEAERLFRQYVAGDLEPLQAPLRGQPLEGPLMDYIASGVARCEADLSALAGGTYTGFSEWQPDSGEFQDAIQSALGRLGAQSLIRRPHGALEATGLGRAMALHGLSMNTAARMGAWLGELGARLPAALETLLVLAATEDGEQFPCALSAAERRQANYLEMARERLAEAAESCAVLRAILWPEGGLTTDQIQALKKAFLLEEWISGRETSDIEDQFGVLAGTIANLAAHIHWLALALGDAAAALGLSLGLRQVLEQLGARLPMGLSDAALGLARLHAEGISRGMIQALVREGFDSVKALREAEEAVLERILPPRAVLAIREALEERRPVVKKALAAEGTHAAGASLSPESGTAARPQARGCRLAIDESDPCRAVIDGCAVALTPLQYRLLLALAREASRVVPRARLAALMWPDAAVEDQQITQHSRGLAKALGKAVGTQAAREMIETRRGFGVRLALAPDEVRVAG